MAQVLFNYKISIYTKALQSFSSAIVPVPFGTPEGGHLSPLLLLIHLLMIH